ncbi:hypothetical protein C5167_029189 [Papaver somniferum]|uniref:uncharacterized protein LOC113343618 isoform X2 n=1 Tax=Papaver somniferum TaxID=3469 RepID=UPI000E6FD137|nr:uncharacterized protein LOC113343618 isoform X2 [Papaver somniferum]RZC93212.1 hypothetical protein C5167_029189 [Papaver somniferum]
MGYKKRNPGFLNKPTSVSASAAVATVTAASAEVVAKDGNLSVNDEKKLISTIKVEYDKALDEIRKGNRAKALKFMKELSLQYESVGLVHRALANIWNFVGSLVEDPNEKQMHTKNAIESAKRAVLLAPNSIEFAHFYANLLFESTNDAGYDEIVYECERALAIQNPIDPGEESWQCRCRHHVSTIGDVQQKLRSLAQKAKLASISNGTRSLNNGTAHKFQWFQGPVEVSLGHARRPNEIKKATKTPEERRKEIEASVAAARLVQEKSDLLPTVSAPCKHSSLQKTASVSDGLNHVRSVWDSMALEKKQSLLQVSIEDLKSHFSSSKDRWMLETLLEALLFVQDKRTWRFWVCCRCSEKFTDGDLLVQHVVREHMSSFSPNMQSILPCKVNGSRDSVAFQMPQKPEIKGKVTLSRDSSYLILDEHSIRGDITCKDGPPPDSNALLSWIFAGPSSREQLNSWTHLKKQNTLKGLELLQKREQKYNLLRRMCKEKCKVLRIQEGLLAVESLCVEELKKREHDTRNASQSFEAVFSKRWQELTERKSDAILNGSEFELEALSAVLREAQALKDAPFGCEGTSADVTRRLSDTDYGEKDKRRMLDVLRQADNCFEVAINRLKVQLSEKVERIDGIMHQTVTDMQKLELKIAPLSSYSFREIILPLIQSFIRAHLEELVAKDAKEKSDAAREALLAELELEAKKGIHKGGDSKHNQGKMKDKKKIRDHGKAKNFKVNGGSEQHLQKITTEEIHFSIKSESHPDSEIVGGVNVNDLTQQEEEYRHKIELEAEERKLEEILEYQRSIENEGKQKHLAVDGEALENCFVPSEGWIGRQHKRHNSSSTVVKGSSRSLNSENDIREVGIFPNEDLVKEHASVGDWRTPHVGNNTSQARQISSVIPGPRMLPPEMSSESDELRVSHGETTFGSINGMEILETRFKNEAGKYNCWLPQLTSSESDCLSVSQGEIIFDNKSGTEVLGTGLKNEAGDYNCFLNVIIQTLWHLKRFREEFLGKTISSHLHVGDPCGVCALYDILMALRAASTDMQTEAVAPTSLRVALSNLYPDSNFFQQMNDASEVMAVIFDCLHRSFTSVSSGFDEEYEDDNCNGSWDCESKACVAHSLFGMNIFEKMHCYGCGLESKHLKYTSFFQNINASALRTAKGLDADSSFGELLYNVQMNQQLACDPESGGCGQLNYIHQFLSTPPHVFIAVLGWQNTHECASDISATLAALATELDFAVLYRGLLPGNKHRLVSMACYYGQHYVCFAYNCEQDRWTMYDDETVKVIGGWDDVILMCERAHLQPHILFFEAVDEVVDEEVDEAVELSYS